MSINSSLLDDFGNYNHILWVCIDLRPMVAAVLTSTDNHPPHHDAEFEYLPWLKAFSKALEIINSC